MQCSVADAIGLALNDVGVEAVTHVPGYGASEAFRSYNILAKKNSNISFHEEVAYTIAHGCALAGKRSTSLMKAHGFIKAANSCVDSLYTNLTAGFVTIIFDDRDGSHSDNILKIEPILNGMYFPYVIGKSEKIYDQIIEVFLESEKRKMPYVLLVDSADINKSTSVNQNPQPYNYTFKRDILHQVVHPLFAQYQFAHFSSKIGHATQTVKLPKIPNVPNELPERYIPSAQKYVPVFDVFKNIRGSVVTGDTSISSSFAMPPYNAIDMVTYIGGSIPLAMGAYLAGHKDVWAVSGDFGFIAAGHISLIEVIERDIPLKIMIFYNKKAAATGGQKIHRTIMLRILAGYDKYIKHITDPTDLFEIESVLSEASSSDEMRIVLIDY